MPPVSRTPSPRRSAPSSPSRNHTRRQNTRETVRPRRESPWPAPSLLLPPLSQDAGRLLEILAQALAAVRPLRAAHRKALPRDIATLSRLLTVDRAELRYPYWGAPGLASAYIHYFLPWNILRLTRLLMRLPLPDPRLWLERGLRPLLLDAGSGPLTLPLALWLARPDWRPLPLHVLALDTASLPLDVGRDLLRSWAGLSGQPLAWTISMARGPLEHMPRHAARLRRERREDGTPSIWMIGAANVLNELYGKGTEQTAAAEEEELPGGEENTAVTGRLSGVLDALAPLLREGPEGDGAPAPAALFVEPGTRLGGKTIMRLRTLALEGGLSALAPCTHDNPCPLLARRRRGWCHFTFDSDGAPSWLRALSGQAGLAKNSLSLAPLLLIPDGKALSRPPDGARVLSAPFSVPGMRGEARYACAAAGLLLLERAESLPSGSLLPCGIPEHAAVDARSGSLIVPAPDGGRERRPLENDQPMRPQPRSRETPRNGDAATQRRKRPTAGRGRPGAPFSPKKR